jgi:hypothetical protein
VLGIRSNFAKLMSKQLYTREQQKSEQDMDIENFPDEIASLGIQMNP